MTIAHPPHPTTSLRDKFSVAEIEEAQRCYDEEQAVHRTAELSMLFRGANGVPHRRVTCTRPRMPFYLHTSAWATSSRGVAPSPLAASSVPRITCISSETPASVYAQLACEYTVRMQQQQQQQQQC